MYATNVAGVYATMYVVKLGMYPFVVPEGYDTPPPPPIRSAWTWAAATASATCSTCRPGLLRAAKTTNVTITDSDTGEVYLNSDGLNVRKAMYNSSSRRWRGPAMWARSSPADRQPPDPQQHPHDLHRRRLCGRLRRRTT